MTSQASPPPIYALTPGRLTGDGPGLTSLVEDVRATPHGQACAPFSFVSPA